MPFLQPKARVLGLVTNLTKANSKTRLQEEMRDLIRLHEGEIFVLSDSTYVTQDLHLVHNFYELDPSPEQCLPVETHHEESSMYLCPVLKRAS